MCVRNENVLQMKNTYQMCKSKHAYVRYPILRVPYELVGHGLLYKILWT